MRERSAEAMTPDRRPKGADRPSRTAQGRGLALGGAAYQAGARVLRVLPAQLRHAAATPGGAAWFWLSAGQRRAALDNYAAALGLDRSDPEVARVARRAFQNYGRMLMDFLLLGDLTRDDLVKRMTIDGRDHLDAALAKGRGVIMAVPHMGSWDMAGSFGGVLGYPVSAVAERFPGSLNAAVVRTRQRFGLNVITLGRSAVRAITLALQGNGVVALLCDLPACQYATSPGRYHVHMDPALRWTDGESKEGLMQRVVSRFEDFIKERPDQWYAFRPMFARDVG